MQCQSIPRLRRFFYNQSLFPFETMWAFFCVYASVAAMLGYGITVGPLTRALGPTVALVFNLIFCLAGAAIYFGVGLQRGNVEAFGLLLLLMSLTVRTVVNGWLFGWNPMAVNSYILNGAFVLSCVIRLAVIVRHPKTVVINGQ